jgi:sugar-specific transcriptional regulator TrmB
MKETIAADLSQLGLTPTEAQVDLALLQNGAMGASAIAAATGLARTAVYPTLGSLVDRGLAHAGEGYGSRFSAVAADEALPHLLAADKEALLHRERLTGELIERISTFEERAESAPDEVIQVIRSPRAVAERFERLELEAEKQIDLWTKPPFFSRSGNPTLEKALRRGVKARSLYEKSALDDPGVRPYFHNWITAGEEARIYKGELPHKLAIFDSQIVLMPLIRPGHQTKTLLIRHAQLAESLSLAFQFVWDRSEPVADAEPRKKAGRKSPIAVRAKHNRNHQPTRVPNR